VIVLDAGAFIAAERSDRAMWTRIKSALAAGPVPITSAAVLAQVWREDPRNALLSRLVKATQAVPLDTPTALAVGWLLAQTGTADAVDAALVLAAADGDIIYASDPNDLTPLASVQGLHVEVIPV
jgi:hypothetical protein